MLVLLLVIVLDLFRVSSASTMTTHEHEHVERHIVLKHVVHPHAPHYLTRPDSPDTLFGLSIRETLVYAPLSYPQLR